MKKNESLFTISILCILLGLLLVTAFYNAGPGIEIGENISIVKINQMLNEKKQLEGRRENLLQSIDSYKEEIENFESRAAKKSYGGEEIQKELLKLRIISGLVDVQGSGIEITLNDRKKDDFMTQYPDMIANFIVHDSDLLNIVNELRAAGAEAISINDTRIMETSRISCGGPTINIGTQSRFAPPFIIRAIGDPDTLVNAFQKPDSISHILVDWGLQFEIKKSKKVPIPAIYGSLEYKYAKSYGEGE